MSVRFRRLATDYSLWKGCVVIDPHDDLRKAEFVARECLNSGTGFFVMTGKAGIYNNYFRKVFSHHIAQKNTFLASQRCSRVYIVKRYDLTFGTYHRGFDLGRYYDSNPEIRSLRRDGHNTLPQFGECYETWWLREGKSMQFILKE